MAVYTLEEYAKLKKKKDKQKNIILPDGYEEQVVENAITLEENMKRKGISLDTLSSGIAPISSDIAPIGTTVSKKDDEEESLLDFFQKGAFKDGYNFGDVTKTILGTVGDAGVGIVKGAGSLVEGVVDAGRYGVAGISDKLGNETYADKVREKAKKDSVENFFKGTDEYLNEYSVLGRTSDAILQGVGQVGGIIGAGLIGGAVGLGTVGATALTTGLMGVSSTGSGMSEAYQGGATDEEATKYGISKGVIDAGTELLFGGLGKTLNAVGLSKGISSLDDVLAQKLSSKISNQVAKNFAEFGVKASAEGFEEVLAGLGSAVAKKLTYMDEEELSEIVKDENLLEQFVVGTVTSGIIQSGYIPKTAEGSLKEANKTGIDFITGYTQNEQVVIDKEVEKRVGDQKLSKKELGKIEEQVKKDLEKGYIDIDTIESALGGETYNQYKSITEQEETLTKQLEELKNAPNTVGNAKLYEETENKLAELKKNSNKDKLKEQLSKEVQELTKSDLLIESYNEKGRRSQKYEADLTKYDEKQQAVIKKAAESGILNNTNRTHEFVDMIAKISADKGVLFDFTNNTKLKETGFGIEGKTVNGYIKDGNIAVNIDSNKALNTVVGHEITHVLEGTELYTELQSVVKEFATTKGEYQARYDALKELYKDVEGAVIENEITADLVGEYLFTDSDFINNLSTEKPNIFKKIYEEIKYLYKLATAGSKEARELEKVKRAFDKTYKETNNAEQIISNAEYALSKIKDNKVADRLTPSEWNIVKSSVADYKKLNYNYQKTADGDIIIPVGNKLVYTDANFDSPGIRKIIEIGSDYEYDVDYARKELYAVEKGESTIEEAYEIIRLFTKIEDINEYQTDNRANAGKYDRRTSRGKSQSDTYHNNFLQERIRSANEIINSVNNERSKASSKDGVFSNTQKDADIRYSLSKDNQGQNLSDKQKEYFKDSKVVNDKGELVVVYHGTRKADFTVFNRNYNFFTDSEEMADSYAPTSEKFKGYLNIKKPFVVDAQGEKWSGIPIDAELKELLETYGSSVFKEKGKWRTSTEDIVVAIEEAVDEGSLDYDGIIIKNVDDTGSYHKGKENVIANDYIVFNSNQFKNIDNVNPTDNKDIRYLMGELEVAPIGNYRVYGKDIALEKDVAPTTESLTTEEKKLPVKEESLMVDYAPLTEEEAPKEDMEALLDEAQAFNSLEEQQEEKLAELDSVVEAEDTTEPAALPTIESFNTKVENYKNALEGYKTAKDTIETAFDDAINKKTAEYEALKRKDTKKATDLLMQIENLKLRKNNNVTKIDSKIAKVEATIDKLSNGIPTKRQIYHRNIVENIKNTFSSKGFDFDKVLENAKNKGTFSSVDNTPQRFIEKSLGYKEGQILNDLTVNKVAQNESKGIQWVNSYTDKNTGLLAKISKEYGIKPRSKESAAAQMYAEGFWVDDDGNFIKYGDEELVKDFRNEKVRENIKKLAKDERIRKIYDDTLKMINDSRKRNLYPEIPRRKNYFLHFREMEDTFSKLGIPFNPNDIRLKDLPTDINGMTADLKPGQPYFASAKQRMGYKTTYDLVGGVERYLNSAKNQIYHIDDIQTLRALRNYIADTFGQAKGLESLDSMTEEEAVARIEEVYNSHLSTFAKFLNEEANTIAGKTSLTDRGLEGVIGRRGIQFLDTVNRQVGSNMVGGNISSALTNTVSMVQAVAKSNKFDATKAFAQTVRNQLGSIIGKTDGFVENNPMMIRRKGIERMTKTPWESITDKGYLLMGAIDNISSEFIARTKFNELTRKGMSEQQAHIEADKWASRILGDRSIGQQPQLYNSKMLGLITKFQLEVRNQLDSQFYDTIQEAKVSNEEIENKLIRNMKTSAKIGSTFFQLAVLQHLFGKGFESIAGYNPTFDIVEALIQVLGFDDDEESEDTVLDNLEEGFLTLLEDLPYTSTFTGGRIPISSALPVKQFITGKDSYGNEKSRWETIKETAPYYLAPTGYGQFKKTMQGLEMFSDEHPVAGSYTKSGNLRFPIEDTPENRVRSAIFGQYASENARDYFDNERSPLKEKQIQEYKDLDIPIRDYWEYREGLSKQDKLEDKFDYIAGLDLPVEKKNIMINNIVDRKEAVDMTGYDDFGSLEEFDFATKQPEKYALSKVVGGYSAYSTYQKELNDIKADKDANGKTISGSRKEKVLNYIENLDADYYEKIILFKSEYKADDTYNEEIVNYLNNRSDIAYEEEVEILKGLGFTVEADGTVRW